MHETIFHFRLASQYLSFSLSLSSDGWHPTRDMENEKRQSDNEKEKKIQCKIADIYDLIRNKSMNHPITTHC